MHSYLSTISSSLHQLIGNLNWNIGRILSDSKFLLLTIQSQTGEEELLAEQAEQIEDLKMWIVAFLIVAFVIIVVMTIVIQSNRILRRQNTTIKSQQEEISRINNNLAIQVENLKELNSEKNSVISYVSHDLITPLSNIEGLVNLVSLKKENLSSEQEEYLKKMRDVVKNGKETIQSMLNINKIEQEFKGIDLMEHEAISLIEEVLLGYQYQMDEKKINVRKEYILESIILNTDKQYFKQIIGNLLSNAIINTPENEEVTISCDVVDGNVKIKINDKGEGLSEKDKERIFLKYTQSRGVGNQQGISLAIVKQLVDKLNAKIRVESKPGHGTQFILEFSGH